jgi:Fe-S cluster assembly scaffold protein SufB
MNNKSSFFDSCIAYIGIGAKVKYIQVEIGSKNSSTKYTCDLAEESETYVNSIYFGDGERNLDLNYLVNHFGRSSTSNIQIRGALKDRASKTFNGTIDFKKGSSKSKGSEEEYVILFDKTVKSTALPVLLCSEDDVKGKHAASAGKVSSDKLFYMMSRGINKEEAMKLLVEASLIRLLI